MEPHKQKIKRVHKEYYQTWQKRRDDTLEKSQLHMSMSKDTRRNYRNLHKPEKYKNENLPENYFYKGP